MLRVGRRVALKPVSVHLQDGWALAAHVVDHRPARLERLLQVAAINLDARHTVVLALQVDVVVGRHVGRERVDGAAVVDDDEEQRQLLLCSGVQALGHPAILRTALAHKHNRDAVVVLVLVGLEHPVEQDGPSRAGRVRQLLANQRPAALEVGVLVVDVHGPAGAAASASVLAK
eukprot:scaffold3810_cov120-Isochrysis_galbana.AAC.5